MSKETIKKKVEIQGERVKMLLYVEGMNLVCEVYVDGEFIEKFMVNIVTLFSSLKS
jgi:hypothetical protein